MALKGFRFSAVEAAIKKPGRLDLALIFSVAISRSSMAVAVPTHKKLRLAADSNIAPPS